MSQNPNQTNYQTRPIAWLLKFKTTQTWRHESDSSFLFYVCSRGLYDVLREKYEWDEKDALEFSAFLLPMLDFNTDKRATAVQCIEHPWLRDVV